MTKIPPFSDPQKKYWWVLLIVVPIILALIAILPQLLKKESPSSSETPKIEQNAENVNQSTDQGSNVNNVAGKVTLSPSSPTEEKKP